MQVKPEVETHRTYLAELDKCDRVNNVLLREENEQEVERAAHIIRDYAHEFPAERPLP